MQPPPHCKGILPPSFGRQFRRQRQDRFRPSLGRQFRRRRQDRFRQGEYVPGRRHGKCRYQSAEVPPSLPSSRRHCRRHCRCIVATQIKSYFPPRLLPSSRRHRITDTSSLHRRYSHRRIARNTPPLLRSSISPPTSRPVPPKRIRSQPSSRQVPLQSAEVPPSLPSFPIRFSTMPKRKKPTNDSANAEAGSKGDGSATPSTSSAKSKTQKQQSGSTTTPQKTKKKRGGASTSRPGNIAGTPSSVASGIEFLSPERQKELKSVKMQEKKLTEVEEIESTALSIISSNSKSTRLNVHRTMWAFAAECELSADEAEIFLQRYQVNHNCVSPPSPARSSTTSLAIQSMRIGLVNCMIVLWGVICMYFSLRTKR